MAVFVSRFQLASVPLANAAPQLEQVAEYRSRSSFSLIVDVGERLGFSGREQRLVVDRAFRRDAILALVTHAMIPEALHKGGSGIVLPAVGGFLFALYLALLETAVA